MTFTQRDSCETQCDDDRVCFAMCMESAKSLKSRVAARDDDESMHDCDKEYRLDCASCNGVSPGDVGTW